MTGPLAIVALVASGVAAWLAAALARGYAPDGRAPGLVPLTAAAATAFLAAAAVATSGAAMAVSLVLGSTLLALAAVDLACFRLPDALTLPLAAAGLAATALAPERPILAHLAGAAGAWGLMAGFAWAFHAWTGREGLGLGDAKLLAAAGAWLGWRPLPWVLLLACLFAFAWIAPRLAVGRGGLRDRLAFGAPLCLAIWATWLYGAPGG